MNKYFINRKMIAKKSVIFIISCFLIFGLIIPTRIAGQEEKQSVLYLSSYSQAFPSIPKQLCGIQAVLQDNYYLDIEYMDMKRFATTENEELFYDLFKYKISNSPAYDAVIVGDDYALQFVMDYQEEFFNQIPVIFIGVNDLERAEEAVKRPNIAGILETISMGENIEMAKKLMPETTKVAAIVDSTLSGQGEQKQFEEAALSFPELEPMVLNVSDYSFEEFGEILQSLDRETIVLFLSMNQDKTGQYLNLEGQFDFIRNHTSTPVYRASFEGVGQGLFGGKLLDFEEFGRQGAELAVEVMQGRSTDSIGLITETPYYYSFDYELVKKFGINENLIPKEAVFVNKPESFLVKYQDIIVTAGMILLFLGVVITILVFDNMKRRKAENELKKSNERLIQTYENLYATEEELRIQYEMVQEHVKEVDVLNQIFNMATESTSSAVWEYKPDTRRVRLSDGFFSMFNRIFEADVDYDTYFEELFLKEDKLKLDEEINRYLVGEIAEINLQMRVKNHNQLKWMLVRGKGIVDEYNVINNIHGLLIDTTKLKEQEAYIEYLAQHDYLTQLPNRHQFMNRLDKALKNKKSGAVILFDIDNFKAVNDTMGHIFGDRLLLAMAERLKQFISETMMIARFGGDEFLLLYLGEQDCSELSKFAETIQNDLQKAIEIDGIETFLNVSMGITCFPKDSKDLNQLIMNADTAMYKVKRSGKNNYIFYHEKMNQEMKDKLETENILRKALKEDGFKLVYQPQVKTSNGEIVGFEALLRLKNYPIGPDVFIAIAEETGLIIEIGRWVLREVVNQLKNWQDLGLSPKIVAVNFSSKQLRDKGYLSYLKQLLFERELMASQIEIEITESILLENNEETMAFLNDLKTSGFRIALDDFGTGYASFNYLTYIPVDKVKLDKTINDKFLRHENNAVIDSLIILVHSLGLEITAEGIEEWKKFERLKNCSCDYIQGYLFSRPLEAQAVEKIYDSNLIESYLNQKKASTDK